MHIPEAGGPPQHLRPWLEAAARATPVEVVVPGPGGAERLYSAIARTHVVPYSAAAVPTSPWQAALVAAGLVRDVHRFATLMRDRGPDVVLVATSVLPAALMAARLVGVPAIVYAAEIHGPARMRRPVKASATAATVGLTKGLAAAIVCCSDAVARQYTGTCAPRVTTISPGVSPDDLVADREAARRELDVSGAEPCVAVVGNIAAGRSQADLIRALPSLRSAFPRIRCVVAGATLDRPADQAYAQQLESLVDELGVRDLVRFAGFVDPVAVVYAAADIVVNPARVSEGLGRVALEALAAGRPVVSTRVGAVPEILRDGHDALLVPPGRPDEIAEAVSALCRDARLRERLVTAGQARVVAEFGEGDSTRRFLGVLADVVGAGSLRVAA
jgi:glycosyltransferase involved in cell wall biosynthesis